MRNSTSVKFKSVPRVTGANLCASLSGRATTRRARVCLARGAGQKQQTSAKNEQRPRDARSVVSVVVSPHAIKEGVVYVFVKPARLRNLNSAREDQFWKFKRDFQSLI